MAKNPVQINVKMDGLKDLKKAFSSGGYVKIGILGDKASKTHADTDKTNAEIGVVHEFGRKDNRRPHARSFLRFPIEHKSKDILKELSAKKKSLDKFYAGVAPDMLLRWLAIAAEKAVIQAFETGGYGQWEPDDPRTIKRKGSSSILIDKGELKGSISSEVVMK